MRYHPGAGVWELFIPGVPGGAVYKYEIVSSAGELLPLKADPLSFSQELPPATGSLVHGLPVHAWRDDPWLDRRHLANSRSAPIAVYEVHLGSWRRGQGDAFLSYDRLADELIPYVKDLGFTHIELLPISEHPFSGSWGYQPIGLFAPTSRFGTPVDFARFVDRFHAENIGVLLDWVPAHFPSDVHGLARFDGTALYEHEDPRRGVHKDWNTLVYNYGRREVANFLQSNAAFWLGQYHVDGLRVDAVASMLYLDYSRAPGEWLPNTHGGRENLDAVEFLRRTNTRVYVDHPGAVTVAEESTAWPQVSRPVIPGAWVSVTSGTWAGCTTRLPIFVKIRCIVAITMTNSPSVCCTPGTKISSCRSATMRSCTERDRCSARCPGTVGSDLPTCARYLTFMWMHPGKKLLFMGGEFGQESEWNHDRSLDWHLLADRHHRGVQQLVRDLNRLYRELPALHELDCERDGFSWIDAGNADESVIAFLRTAPAPAAPVMVVANFTPVVRQGYRVGVPHGGRWDERLNSDSSHYGGSNVGNNGGADATAKTHHGRPFSLTLTLPPLAVSAFVHVPRNGGQA